MCMTEWPGMKYNEVTSKFNAQFVTMDNKEGTGGREDPVRPYTRYNCHGFPYYRKTAVLL